MQFRRYKDILATRAENGEVLGFHARNLEVAELSEKVWQALENEITLQKDSEIRAELEVWHKENSPDTTDIASSREISTLLLNVAQICNLKCTYCAAVDFDGKNESAGTYGSKITKIDTHKAEQQISYFLSNLKDSKSFEIEFCGGEPLLYPRVIESLCRYAQLMVSGRDIDLHFAINTNGTLITRESAEMLARYRFHVTVSIDGDPEVNDLTRPVKAKNGYGSTELTVRGLEQLRAVRNQLGTLAVNCVFGAHNTRVERAFDYLESLHLDFDRYNFNFSNNDRSETAFEISNRYLEELKKTAAKLYARDGLSGLVKIKQFRRPLTRLESQTRQHNYCGAGKSLIQSDTRADLYVCNWFMNDETEKIGHLTDLSKPHLEHYGSTLIELNHCQTCWARHLCGGGCMAVHKSFSGNRHEKDPNFCHRTRQIAALAIWYYKRSLHETH